jgi:signal transduction histidine kinase
MDAQQLKRHLDALQLSSNQAPDAAQWQALIQRLTDDPVEAQLLQRERYLEALVHMQTRLLLTEDDHLGAFNHALEPLGQASGADRVYLFENHIHPEDGTQMCSQRAEWCAPSIEPQLHNPDLQELPYEHLIPEWVDLLSHGQHIERLSAHYGDEERRLLGPQGILSLLVFPIFVDQDFIGFIGFDNCSSQTAWTPLEIKLLTSAASQIGLFIAQRNAKRALLQAHADIAEARDRAIEASRAKSNFLAKISHELRTPLNAIIGYSEIMLEAPDELASPQALRDLQHIQDAGHHLLAVINDLLDLSRAESNKLTLHPTPIALPSLLHNLLSSAQQLAKRNQNQIIVDIPDDRSLGFLITDTTRLQQILLNLLSNACKFTHQGTITLSVEPNEHTITFSIYDTGIGIAPEQLQHIFDAFSQADDSSTRAYEGTGLGLTICKHLTQLLGGSLHVQSELGQGSTFTLVLPRHTSR